MVRLDPGLAFGSGTHPTTALCLEWLDGLDLAGKTVTDFGCGSGILAIAALKLGAASAVGVDNDPQALTASADNAERNGVADRLSLFLPQDVEPRAGRDIFLANILAGPLGELAPDICRRGASPAHHLRSPASSPASRTNCCSATQNGSRTCAWTLARTGCASAVAAAERESHRGTADWRRGR